MCTTTDWRCPLRIQNVSQYLSYNVSVAHAVQTEPMCIGRCTPREYQALHRTQVKPLWRVASSSAVPRPICSALLVRSTTIRLWPGLRSGVGWYAGGATWLAMTLWTDGDGRVA
eukprot:COSAG02_NODE_1922_length_10360_cov_38.101452_13_plen_114_part_00